MSVELASSLSTFAASELSGPLIESGGLYPAGPGPCVSLEIGMLVPIVKVLARSSGGVIKLKCVRNFKISRKSLIRRSIFYAKSDLISPHLGR